MDVKFIATERKLVDTVPITDGQVIASTDGGGVFYDMEQKRRQIGMTCWLPMEDSDAAPQSMITDASDSIIELQTNGGSNIVLQPELGVSNIMKGEVGEATPVSKIPSPTRSGYRFLGWYEDQKNPDAPSVETFPGTFTPGKTIYYASWAKES